ACPTSGSPTSCGSARRPSATTSATSTRSSTSTTGPRPCSTRSGRAWSISEAGKYLLPIPISRGGPARAGPFLVPGAWLGGGRKRPAEPVGVHRAEAAGQVVASVGLVAGDRDRPPVRVRERAVVVAGGHVHEPGRRSGRGQPV